MNQFPDYITLQYTADDCSVECWTNIQKIRKAITYKIEYETFPIIYYCDNSIDDMNELNTLKGDHDDLIQIKKELEERGFECEVQLGETVQCCSESDRFWEIIIYKD